MMYINTLHSCREKRERENEYITLSLNTKKKSYFCIFLFPFYIKNIFNKIYFFFWIQTTPTVLKRFDAETLKKTLLGTDTSLRILVLGGEKFPSSTVFDRWCAPTNATTVYNIYGITEVSCWASLYCVRGPTG